jgi:hypothetical protein
MNDLLVRLPVARQPPIRRAVILLSGGESEKVPGAAASRAQFHRTHVDDFGSPWRVCERRLAGSIDSLSNPGGRILAQCTSTMGLPA